MADQPIPFNQERLRAYRLAHLIAADAINRIEEEFQDQRLQNAVATTVFGYLTGIAQTIALADPNATPLLMSSKRLGMRHSQFEEMIAIMEANND